VTKLNAFLKNNKYPLILGVSTSTLCFALDAWPQVGKVLILCAMMVGFQCGLSAAEEIIKKVSGSLPLQSANQSPSGVTRLLAREGSEIKRATTWRKRIARAMASGEGFTQSEEAMMYCSPWHCMIGEVSALYGRGYTELARVKTADTAESLAIDAVSDNQFADALSALEMIEDAAFKAFGNSTEAQ
jgi:hypothetical protein